jgi:hypothetical protein
MADVATPVPTERVVGQIEDFLQEAIGQMPPDEAEMTREGPGRPRVLPALCLWAGLLVCVLRGFSSQLALWRLLSSGNFWFYPRFALSDQAVYTRLAAAGTTPLESLFEQIRLVLAERLAPYAAQDLAPFAPEVLALDESTLDQVARHLPTLRAVPPGDRRLLPGKIAGLFDLRRQQWHRVQLIPTPTQNEKVAARTMLDGVPAGSLLLMDLGYFAFAFFDELTERSYYWISRLRAKTSFTVHHVFYQDAQTFDGLIWLGAYRADRAKHAVRLVRFHVGPKEYSYLSNVRDPLRLPLAEIARLYARRWDFELAVKLIKRHLHLHLLWSAKDVVICQQLWAVLIIAQILHALQLEIAGRAGVDPFDVSLALLVQYLPHYAYTGQDPVAFFVAEGRRLRFIRPSTRTIIQAPTIPPDKITHPPPNLTLVRPPRYAQRNCGKRPAKQPAKETN